MRGLLWFIFGLALLMGLGFGAWAALQWRDGSDLAELDRRLRTAPQSYPVDGVAAHLDQRRAHASGYRTAAVGGIAHGVALLALLGAALLRRRRLTLGLAIGVIGVGVTAVLLSPLFEMGLYGPAPPRLLAMLYAIPGGVAALAMLWLLRESRWLSE